jgi:hypothetical protein
MLLFDKYTKKLSLCSVESGKVYGKNSEEVVWFWDLFIGRQKK